MADHRLVACVDFGSTFTKAALVDLADGALLATASHRTTLDTDVLDGWDVCRARLAEVVVGAADAPVLACSSAGGGLRIGVVGNEALVTAEAGRRVALSSGGRVVHVAAGGLAEDAGPPTGPGRPDALDALRASRPDVLLLVGGTDGGNAEVLLAAARRLAAARWQGPVVVAGNVAAQPQVAALLDGSGTPYVLTDNVVPRIGVVAPDGARAAIREMFLRHVIGGKQLSSRTDFVAMVRAATPDAVLAAVELLARGLGPDRPGAGDVAVVDVGGATTDVHSVVEPDPEESGLARQVVAPLAASRTVEGDLGMRWSAVPTVAEGLAAGVLPAERADRLRAAAQRRADDPALLPGGGTGRDEHDRDDEDDLALATAAAAVALRRHAGRQQVVFGADGRVLSRSGKDLREVALLVGSGGVLRHHRQEVSLRVLEQACRADEDWLVPARPRVVVDVDYVLAAAGLLARAHPAAAHALLAPLLASQPAR